MPNADLRSRRPAGTLRAFAAGGMALLAACSTSPTEKNTDGPPIPVEPPIPVLSVDPTTNGQVGVVGARLAKPIRVIAVTSSGPKAGVIVNWLTTFGRVQPASSVTDSTGSATAEWVLDTRAGYQTVVAQIQERADTSVIHATALGGPPVRLRAWSDGVRQVPVNRAGFHLAVSAYDGYGNPTGVPPVAWAVIQGHLRRGDVSDGSVALFAPDGVEGPATIRASTIVGSVDHSIMVGPPEPFVALELEKHSYVFRSAMNGSQPAVDTIPAGTTMTWILDDFDRHDDPHHIVSVGGPSFPSTNFRLNDGPFDPHTASIRFPTAGVYLYADDYGAGILGTLVVR